MFHAERPADSDAAAARRQAGQRQSASAALGTGMRKVSSMHQQPPSRPPLPQSNATPQRAQARRRGGNPCSVVAAFMASPSGDAVFGIAALDPRALFAVTPTPILPLSGGGNRPS